jgi:hypothetical protein
MGEIRLLYIARHSTVLPDACHVEILRVHDFTHTTRL